MTWLILSLKVMQAYIQKNFLFLIAMSMIAEFTTALTAPTKIIPITISVILATMIPFASHIEKWWYAPSWMIITIVVVYAHDLYMAIRLTGELNSKAWEFRSDKATIWFSNLIGALLTIGLLHFLPLAAKAILTSTKMPQSGTDAVFYTLMSVGWGAFILISLSNIASGVSNAARAGVYPRKVAEWIIERIDTYKPSIYKKPNVVGEK